MLQEYVAIFTTTDIYWCKRFLRRHLNMNDSNCAKVALPYPDLKVSERNCMYAQLLMQDFSASKGEDTAIHQYLYQAWTLREPYPEIYNTLMCISKVEMYHFNVIAAPSE